MRYVIKLEYNRRKLIVFDTANPNKEYALVDPNLHLETDNAGSFEATFPVSNIAVLKNTSDNPWFSKYITRVVVYYTHDNYTQNPDDFKMVWRGRLLSVETDFYGQIHTYFEGDLATLNDTIQFPHIYHYDENASSTGTSVGPNQTNFSSNTCPITQILNHHNDKLQMKNLSNHDETSDDYDALQDQRIWFVDVSDSQLQSTDYTYTRLSIKPEDWDENYRSYFVQTKTRYQTLYSNNTDPVFVSGKFFSRIRDTRVKNVLDNVFSQNDLVVEKETTMSVLQKIVDNYGGHYRMLYDTYYEGPDHGVLSNTKIERARLQWIEIPKEYSPDTPVSQYIVFGENLIDFTKTTEIKDFVSCIRPRGKKIHSAGATALGTEYRVASLPGTYTVLNDKPADWDSNFWSYYELRRQVIYCPLYKSYKAPEFVPGKYYSFVPNGSGIIKEPSLGVTQNSFACVLGTLIHQNASSSSSMEMNKFNYMEEPFYVSTGYWDSADSGPWYGPRPYQHSFACYPGEQYYILATGGYDPNKRITACIITDGVFRNWADNDGEYTWWFTPVSNTQTTQATIGSPSADKDDESGRSGMIYKLVTVPDYKWGNGMYINLTARTHYDDSNPATYDHLHMNIWGTRTVSEFEDEYITLCGIGDGTWPAYMGTISNDTEANKRRMQNSIDNKTENIPVFVEPATVDGTNFDGYFLYPVPSEPVIGFFDGVSNFPEPISQNVGKLIGDISTGNIYRCEGRSSGYVYVLINGERLYYKEADAIYDVKLVKEYGVVENVVDYDEIDDPETLKNLACETLYSSMFEKMSLSVTALDLALLDSNVDIARIMDPIHIVSPYHKVDMLLPLQTVDIPFNDLDNQTFNIGYEKEQKITDRQKIQNIKKG